jgi:hypothetical protein
MATLILDNGVKDSELLKSNEQLFAKLGINILRSSPYKPLPKFTERFFRGIHSLPKKQIKD